VKVPLFTRYATALSLVALLAGCAMPTAPQPSAPPVSPAEVTELREQLQQTDARLQRLQDGMVMLEVRILDQQRLVDTLRKHLASSSGVPLPAGTANLYQKSPAELYLAAFGDYTSGRYRQAIEGFTAFLRFYPSNDYAVNVRFLLAEAFLAQGDYKQSAVEFTQLLKEYPQSEKAPEALLKLAATQHAMKLPDQAAESLRQLRERYPDSAAARKAANAEP
jgi:tol-pal system protein YbgF